MTPEEVRYKTYGKGNHSSQLLEHPDFADCTADNPHEVRWDMMQPYLKPQGVVLDIGCHNGWWCRKFSHFGWGAIGVDNDPNRIAIASDFMKPYDNPVRRPVYHQGDIHDFAFGPVDVVLCLGMAMLLFGDEEQGWRTFKGLSESSPLMFLDYQLRYGSSMPRHFAEQVIEHTDYTKYTFLENPELRAYRFYVFER